MRRPYSLLPYEDDPLAQYVDPLGEMFMERYQPRGRSLDVRDAPPPALAPSTAKAARPSGGGATPIPEMPERPKMPGRKWGWPEILGAGILVAGAARGGDPKPIHALAAAYLGGVRRAQLERYGGQMGEWEDESNRLWKLYKATEDQRRFGLEQERRQREFEGVPGSAKYGARKASERQERELGARATEAGLGREHEIALAKLADEMALARARANMLAPWETNVPGTDTPIAAYPYERPVDLSALGEGFPTDIPAEAVGPLMQKLGMGSREGIAARAEAGRTTRANLRGGGGNFTASQIATAQANYRKAEDYFRLQQWKTLPPGEERNRAFRTAQEAWDKWDAMGGTHTVPRPGSSKPKDVLQPGVTGSWGKGFSKLSGATQNGQPIEKPVAGELIRLCRRWRDEEGVNDNEIARRLWSRGIRW